MILFSADAILASSTSTFGIEIPRIDDEDLNSSTDSTNSTSLIHCIASVGNCEQVHTSVLNLICQQAKVAGVGNLEMWRSEICTILWRVSSTEDGWIFDWRSRLASQTSILLWPFTFLRCRTYEAAPQLPYSIDSILEGKELMKMHVDLQKRFPIYHVSPKCMAALLCGAAIRKNASTSLQVFDVVGKTLVDW